MIGKAFFILLAACLLATMPAFAQVVPCGPFTSGFTHSFQSATAWGPFSPPVSETAEQFYQFPGVSPFGLCPGGGFASDFGVGFTPNGYGPFGGFTYL